MASDREGRTEQKKERRRKRERATKAVRSFLRHVRDRVLVVVVVATCLCSQAFRVHHILGGRHDGSTQEYNLFFRSDLLYFQRL